MDARIDLWRQRSPATIPCHAGAPDEQTIRDLSLQAEALRQAHFHTVNNIVVLMVILSSRISFPGEWGLLFPNSPTAEHGDVRTPGDYLSELPF